MIGVVDAVSHLPGLPCRVPSGCSEKFVARLERPDSMDVLHWAVRERDEHERRVHGYHHPPPLAVKWHYGERSGQRAR